MAIVSIKWAGLKDPNKQPSFQDATGAAPVLPTPTFTSATTTSYTVAITGYDAQFTYTVSASVGSAVRTDGNVTVSGLTGNQSSTLTVTAANTARELSFSSAVAFLSLPATPTLSRSGGTTTTVTVAIGNYDAGLTYTIGASAGSATRSGNTITVTGLTQGQATTVTATASNSSGSSTQGSLATGAVPATPTLSVTSTTTSSATISITNYDSGATYSVSSTSGSASHSAGTITVTGLSEGSSGTVTATATKNSIASNQGSVGFNIPVAYWLSSLGTPTGTAVQGITRSPSGTILTSSGSSGTAFTTAHTSSGDLSFQSLFTTNTSTQNNAKLSSDSGFYYFSYAGRQVPLRSWVNKVQISNNSIAWSRELQSGSSDLQNYQVTSDSSGNVYYCGTAVYSDGRRGHLVKYNSSGVLQWQKSFGGTFSNNQEYYSVTVDSSLNVYVGGYITDSGQKPFLVKYNSSGTLQWVRALNSAGNAYASLKTDSNGDVYGMSIDFSSTFYLTKYSSSGVYQWTYSTQAFSSNLGEISINSNNEVFLTATQNSFSTFASGILFKFNSSGIQAFGRRFTAPGANQLWAVDSDNSSIYLAGQRYNNTGLYCHKIPTDGSKLGSYTVGGVTFTYATESRTTTLSSSSYTPTVTESGERTLTATTGSAAISSNTSYTYNKTNI